jgi:hypothetical protein
MKHKAYVGATAVVLGVLVVTHPVVVTAAGQVTSGQIKNNTIKSKDIKNNQVTGTDIKNGSVQSGDLAPGVLPTTVVKRIFNDPGGALMPNAFGWEFTGSAVITADGKATVVASGTVTANAQDAGDEYAVAVCSRPAGSAAEPVPLGGADSATTDVDAPTPDDNLWAASGAAVLPAGNHEVGVCLDVNDVAVIYETVGWVQVVGG